MNKKLKLLLFFFLLYTVTIAQDAAFRTSGSMISNTSTTDNPENETGKANARIAASGATSYFKRPVSPFITHPDEKIIPLIFNHCEVSVVQEQIDGMRSSEPDALLSIHLRGTVFVEEKPLTLPSNILLSFEGCGKMLAIDTSGCNALIHIKDVEYVSITSVDSSAIALLDGNGLADTGIVVSNSGKINIDNINIVGCKNYGIDYTGRGASLLNEAGSVTRCNISGSETGGICVNNSTRFVLMDNVVSGSGCGINVISKSASIVGNTCVDNNIGLSISEPSSIAGPGAVVARNTLANNTIGLDLTSNTKNNIVTENEIKYNDTGFIADGYRNHIYNNNMVSNTRQFEVKGRENIIAQNKNISADEITGGTNTRFFDPPTIGNPHNKPVIVSGMGRRDLTFTQETGQEDIDLAVVQAAVDAERNSYLNDVVVVWLNGNFVAKNEYTGLDMPINTCVVLNGTIYPEGDGMDRWSASDHYLKHTNSGGTQLILMKNSGYASFSGGILDCKNLCAYGIYAPGNNVGIIDSVNIKEAVDNNLGTLYHSGDNNPLFIRGCKFQGLGTTNRAIWMHICNNVHCISNYSENHFADFADIDAAAQYNTVLFCTSSTEKRTGIFIEEKASNNFCLGNTMLGDLGNGIALYNTLGGACENNIIIGNTITGPFGMNIRHAKNTFAFNNICNTGRFGVYINVTDNYSSQNSLVENNFLLNEIEENPYFTSPYYSYELEDCDCSEKVLLGSPSIVTHGIEGESDITFMVVFDDINNSGADIILGFADLEDGSATSGLDYETIPEGANITVPAGSNIGTYLLKVFNDDLLEYEETINVEISIPSDAFVAIKNVPFSALIIDDESYVASITTQNSGSEDNPTDVVFTVSLNRENNTGASIYIPIADGGQGTATPGMDYIAIEEGELVEIVSGDSSTHYCVGVFDDNNLELSEEMSIKINPSGNILVLDSVSSAIITDDDVATAELNGSETLENDTIGLVFTVTLDGVNETGEDIIFFELVDLDNGSAYSVIDYEEISPWNAKIVVPEGSSTGKYIAPIIDDQEKEGDESVNVEIRGCSSDRVIINKAQATAYIIDDESSAGIVSKNYNEIVVYPNPANDRLTISSNSKIESATIEITSISGSTVYQESFTANEIDISSLKPGVYQLSIMNEKMKKTSKIIKL